VDLPAARFGAPGQFVLTGGHSASAGQTTFKSGASRLGYSFSPGIDWFVIRNFSLGAEVAISHFDDVGFFSDGSTVRDVGSSWSVGGRVAYNIPLSAWASWYPRVTVGYEESKSNTRFVEFHDAPQQGAPAWSPFHTSRQSATAQLFAPLLLHLRSHVFVGFGPSVVHSFAGEQTRAPGAATGATTRLGAGLLVGGYFGGPPEPLPEDARPELSGVAPAQFGEAGVVTISAESALSGHYSFDDKTSFWSGDLTLAPSVDYFFTDLVSAGASIVLSDARARGYDIPTGKAYESVETQVGGGARIGINGRLAWWLSVYPRAEVDILHVDRGSAVSGQGAEHDTVKATASLFVPLVFHLSQHLFVGVGPKASADILSKRDDGLENQAAFIGASALVGGWWKPGGHKDPKPADVETVHP
jgi:hypothetical protein